MKRGLGDFIVVVEELFGFRKGIAEVDLWG